MGTGGSARQTIVDVTAGRWQPRLNAVLDYASVWRTILLSTMKITISAMLVA
jgi:hypothetical protein